MRQALAGLLAFPLFAGTAVRGTEHLFVLSDASHLQQFGVKPQQPAALEKIYSAAEFPGVFPAATVTVLSGNVLRLTSVAGASSVALRYDPKSNALIAFANEAGSAASLAGRVLVTPDTTENFRGASSLYSAQKDPAFVAGRLCEKVRQTQGADYHDFFVLDGMVFRTAADRIDRLSDRDGAVIPAESALSLTGSHLGRAAVSPWGEAFVADATGKALQRVVWRNGRLESNGLLANPAFVMPGALAFDPDGELFVASGATGANAILRFRFVLDGFVSWRAVPDGGIDLAATAALDLALAKPVGYVISEQVDPLVAIGASPGNVHNRISQSIYVSPAKNSETATVALVQYAPGGFTAVHLHPQMEQMEIVIEGRALWEIGEVEREVGPGDVIFCPRNVKHGYKVLGDKPFKFYQVEWREWAIGH